MFGYKGRGMERALAQWGCAVIIVSGIAMILFHLRRARVSMKGEVSCCLGEWERRGRFLVVSGEGWSGFD